MVYINSNCKNKPDKHHLANPAEIPPHPQVQKHGVKQYFLSIIICTYNWHKINMLTFYFPTTETHREIKKDLPVGRDKVYIKHQSSTICRVIPTFL